MIHVSNSDTPLEGGKMSCSCFLFPGDPMRLKLQMVYAQRHGYDSWWIGGEGVDMIVSNRGRWEFDIWKISPPTKGVWLKEVSTPKIWVKRCVCVCGFFSDFGKKQRRQVVKNCDPFFLTRLVGRVCVWTSCHRGSELASIWRRSKPPKICWWRTNV